MGMGNFLKTTVLLAGMTGLLLLIGDYFGGQQGMLIAFVIAAVMNFVSYFFSDKIALAIYSAQPVSQEELPRLYAIVERLTRKMGYPMPKLYVIPTDSPNAFATGRNPSHASVAVTRGFFLCSTKRSLRACWRMSSGTSAIATSLLVPLRPPSPVLSLCWRAWATTLRCLAVAPAATMTGVVAVERLARY